MPIASCVLVAALVGWLVVIGRRRDRTIRRQLGIGGATRPEPQPVDRAFDPALCAYCDERGKFACPACSRNTCAEHRPWPVGRFCYSCEALWSAGANKRALVIVPIVIGAMLLVATGFGLFGLVSETFAVGAIVAPLAFAAPLYLRIERSLRRRFRPPGQLPKATARSA